MKKVLIIVGHQNIENLTHEGLRDWRSVDLLKRSTGAGGERDYFNNKVVPILKDILTKAGIDVTVTDAIYHEDIYNQEYDLCLAMHYDGGGSGNRCMASAPNKDMSPPYIYDTAMERSDKFIHIWNKNYTQDTGVTLREDFITSGMIDYYCWDYVGYETPSVILEHFNHTSPRGVELKNQPEVVAEADAKAVLIFLDVLPPQLVLELDKDIKSEFEDAYDLKTYPWYDKYQTGDEFIRNSIEAHNKVFTLEEQIGKLEGELEWYKTQLEKSAQDEAGLRSDLEAARKDASKLYLELALKVKKVLTLEEDIRLLKIEQGVSEGVIGNLGEEIDTLKDEKLILTNANSSLEMEKREIIEQKFVEWLDKQTFKTKIEYIIRILRNK